MMGSLMRGCCNGSQAWLRAMCPFGRGGSTPLPRTAEILSPIKSGALEFRRPEEFTTRGYLNSRNQGLDFFESRVRQLADERAITN